VRGGGAISKASEGEKGPLKSPERMETGREEAATSLEASGGEIVKGYKLKGQKGTWVGEIYGTVPRGIEKAKGTGGGGGRLSRENKPTKTCTARK